MKPSECKPGQRVLITDDDGARRWATVVKMIEPAEGWPGCRWAAQVEFRKPRQRYKYDTFRFIHDLESGKPRRAG